MSQCYINQLNEKKYTNNSKDNINPWIIEGNFTRKEKNCEEEKKLSIICNTKGSVP
jgi:hypothetical protein